MKIPSNKVWTQLNEGEFTGILNNSHNIELDSAGQLRLSRRGVAIASSFDDADLENVVALPYFDGDYIAVTTDRLFRGGLLGSNWSEITDFTPSTTLNSDAIVFNNRLVVTTNSNIDDWDGDTDDDTGLESLTGSVPHPMAIFDSQPTYKLAVGNGNTVKILDTSYTASATVLTLASQFIVTTLAYRAGFLYVGTQTNDGSEARVFIWNGDGTNAQYEVPVGCEQVYSVTPYGTSIAAVTSKGQILSIVGSSTQQLAAFPVFYEPKALWQGDGGAPKVFHRGMVAVGSSLYINIEGDLDTGFLPNMKSGLWVYNPNVGLYHTATSTADTLVNDSSLTLSDSTLTTSANHNLRDGDVVQFVTVSGLTGVSVNYPYYVKVISNNEIKLSLTRKGLLNSRHVTIGGTPGGSDNLAYFPNTSYGSQISRAGAVTLSTINETAKEAFATEVLWSARTTSETGATVYTVNIFHDSNNFGSFTTQRITSDNIMQSWKEIYSFLDGLLSEEDSVVVKYQTKPCDRPMILSGVWADANTINSNESKEFAAWFDIEEGDEVVLYNGAGQGKTAHVTGISNSSGTYSITLDENWGTANQAVDIYYTNFKKIGEYSKGNKEGKEYIKNVLQSVASVWIKIKIEMRGTDIAVNQFELANSIHTGS